MPSSTRARRCTSGADSGDQRAHGRARAPPGHGDVEAVGRAAVESCLGRRPLAVAQVRPPASAGVTTEFLLADSVLIATQAALVALPGAGLPAPLTRFAGRAWSLLLPLSIAVVVAAIALDPAVADGLTWLALLAVPPLAAVALGWAMRGARPALALLAAPMVALAIAGAGGLAGDACAAALTALSCVTLGRLLAGGVPGRALKVGIVAMAVIDAVLVFGDQLQGPNAVLNAAVPLHGLPQLQFLDLHGASLGYGDVFVAGVLGGVLAREGRAQGRIALLVLAFSIAWDGLFVAFDTLPATVPVALALLTAEAARALGRRGHPRRSERHLAAPTAGGAPAGGIPGSEGGAWPGGGAASVRGTSSRTLSGRTAWARNLAAPVRTFLSNETGGAVVLLAATVVALLWANSPWSGSYESVWGTELTVRLGGSGVSLSLREWVNQGLMTFFFLVVGLEAKRELAMGQLRERRRQLGLALMSLGGMATA